MANLESRNKQPKVAVVGVGNLLLKDEGIGVHVVQALQKLDLGETANLEIIDGGTSPDVFLLLQEVDKLIVIDAATMDGEPGTIYRLRPEDLNQQIGGINSVHQVSFTHSLQIMDYLGSKPKNIVIFGIETKEITWGLEPSVELSEKIPEIMKLVLEEVREC